MDPHGVTTEAAHPLGPDLMPCGLQPMLFTPIVPNITMAYSLSVCHELSAALSLPMENFKFNREGFSRCACVFPSTHQK
jgi:hypothetical protein